jgi:hypothetical protein
MKKIITIITLIAFSIGINAQSAFDKFDGMSDVQSVVVGKKMFELMGKVKIDNSDRETQLYLNLIKKLENLRVFVTSNKKAANDMKSTAEKYLKTANLEELMSVNESGNKIQIFVKSGNKSSQIKELFMLIDGGAKEETVILSLTGDFDLDELSILTDKMNLPAGESIKKATKKKN